MCVLDRDRMRERERERGREGGERGRERGYAGGHGFIALQLSDDPAAESVI